MKKYFLEMKSSGASKLQVEFDLSNYATKMHQV